MRFLLSLILLAGCSQPPNDNSAAICAAAIEKSTNQAVRAKEKELKTNYQTAIAEIQRKAPFVFELPEHELKKLNEQLAPLVQRYRDEYSKAANKKEAELRNEFENRKALQDALNLAEQYENEMKKKLDEARATGDREQIQAAEGRFEQAKRDTNKARRARRAKK